MAGIRAAEIETVYTGNVLGLERASNRAEELILRNQTAIINFQRTLDRVNSRPTPDFGGKGAQAASRHYRELNSELAALSPTFARFGGSGAAAGIGALAAGFYSAAKAGISYKEMVEKTTKSFEGMLGSQQAAVRHLRELQDFANRTPFEFEDVVRASQRFVAMGMSARDTIPYLTAIGNAVAKVGGGKEQIDSVSLAIAQVSARGKVSAQEMNQLANALVDGWAPLEQELGKTRGELFKMAEQGEISAATFLNAFRKAHEGGNAMQKQMETLSGATSTLKDYVQQLNAGGFTPLHGILRDVTVELAKMSTEGWNAQRAMVAAASAAKNAFEAANPGLAGYGSEALGLMLGGVPGMQAAAAARAAQLNLAQNPQKFGAGKEQGQKTQVFDAGGSVALNPRTMRPLGEGFDEAQRKAAEAQRQANAETERQKGVVAGLNDELLRLRVIYGTLYDTEARRQQMLLAQSSGAKTLTDDYRKQADALLNQIYLQSERNDVEATLKDIINKSREALRGEQTEVDKVGEALGRYFGRVQKATGKSIEFDAALTGIAQTARGVAAEVDRIKELMGFADRMRGMSEMLGNIPLEPGRAVSNIQGPGPAAFDFANIEVDPWIDFREQFAEIKGEMLSLGDTWREGFLGMAEDGSQMFADMFMRIGEGWKSMLGGLALDFAQSLQRMAAQALANQVWGAVLNLAGNALGGMFGGGLPMAGASKMGGSYLQSSSFVGEFAAGGSFIVGGPSGIDKTPVSLLATRGERVTVETPAQQRQGGGQSVVNHYHITAPAVREKSYVQPRSRRELADMLTNTLRQRT